MIRGHPRGELVSAKIVNTGNSLSVLLLNVCNSSIFPMFIACSLPILLKTTLDVGNSAQRQNHTGFRFMPEDRDEKSPMCLCKTMERWERHISCGNGLTSQIHCKLSRWIWDSISLYQQIHKVFGDSKKLWDLRAAFLLHPRDRPQVLETFLFRKAQWGILAQKRVANKVQLDLSRHPWIKPWILETTSKDCTPWLKRLRGKRLGINLCDKVIWKERLDRWSGVRPNRVVQSHTPVGASRLIQICFFFRIKREAPVPVAILTRRIGFRGFGPCATIPFFNHRTQSLSDKWSALAALSFSTWGAFDTGIWQATAHMSLSDVTGSCHVSVGDDRRSWCLSLALTPDSTRMLRSDVTLPFSIPVTENDFPCSVLASGCFVSLCYFTVRHYGRHFGRFWRSGPAIKGWNNLK